jgi:hypothetical protein
MVQIRTLKEMGIMRELDKKVCWIPELDEGEADGVIGGCERVGEIGFRVEVFRSS